MNKLTLKEYNNNYVVYLYQPEGKGGCGEVVYSFSEGAAIVRTLAEENSTWYANHAVRKIEEFVKKKRNLPLDYTQAWY
jgi:hypothetical protein